MNARRLYCFLIHNFTYLLQCKCNSRRCDYLLDVWQYKFSISFTSFSDVICSQLSESATTLHTQSQARRPPSPADHDQLSSNTASGGLIASAVPSNSKKIKLFDFMSTQPQCNEALKNEQPGVSRDKRIRQIYLQSIEPARIICKRIARHIDHFIHYVTLSKVTSVDCRPALRYCTCPTD